MSASQQTWAFGIAVVFRIGCTYSLSVEAAAKKPFRSSAVTVASLSALPRLSVKLRTALQSCLVPAARLIRLSNLEFCLLIRQPILEVRAAAASIRLPRSAAFLRRSRYFISGVMNSGSLDVIVIVLLGENSSSHEDIVWEKPDKDGLGSDASSEFRLSAASFCNIRACWPGGRRLKVCCFEVFVLSFGRGPVVARTALWSERTAETFRSNIFRDVTRSLSIVTCHFL